MITELAMPMEDRDAVIHFCHSSSGGAGRAARRASMACAAQGLASRFVHLHGEPVGSARLSVTEPAAGSVQGRLARGLRKRIQYEFIPDRRTNLSNTLFSTAYPGADVSRHRLFETAAVIHLHWTMWGITPRTVGNWLARKRPIFWTLHDLWPMTGGCHYPAGCRQFETHCLHCPQVRDDLGLVGNSFAEKLRAYGAGAVHVVAPTHWMADLARRSAMFADASIEVVRNAVELDVFAPREDRARLREAFGFGDDDLVLMLGAYDLAETRKGARVLFEAITSAVNDEALPKHARLNLITFGKSSSIEPLARVNVIAVGEQEDDAVIADLLALADLTIVPSLEDNYPNLLLESLACGTPALAFDVGGLGEMIVDGQTGLLAAPVGSVSALREKLIEFAREHHGSVSMRSACRAAVETENDPARIGRQLHALYESALGRPLASTSPDYEKRMVAAFRVAPVAPDAAPNPDFFAFPTNYALRARIADLRTHRATWNAAIDDDDEAQATRTRLLTLQVRHSHHAKHSGPSQFLRFLPRERYDARHWSTPLNSSLLTGQDDAFRKAGELMGSPGFGRQGNGWLADAEVLAHCAVAAVDLVHFIDADISGLLAPRAAAAVFRDRRRPKFVATFHQPPSILAELVSPTSLGAFDGVVALSEPQRRFLANFVDPSRLIIIPHGVDIDFFRPPPAKPAASSGSVARLLLVGHWLRDTKLAVTALSMLRANGVAAELTIISPAESKSDAEPYVTRLADLSDEELLAEYWAADLLFLPLTDATANNAILEAMASGLPVVTSDVGGTAEMLGDAGVRVPPGDAAALVQATTALLNAPERRAELALAVRRRAEGFSWRRAAALHHEFYQSLV